MHFPARRPAAAFAQGHQPHLPQEVPAVGPGFALAFKLIAKRAGAETVLFLLLTDAAAKGGRRPHVLRVLNPIAPKLGQDNQGIRASLLHNLEAQRRSCSVACPDSGGGKGRAASGGIPPPLNCSKVETPIFEAKYSNTNPKFKPSNISQLHQPWSTRVARLPSAPQSKHSKTEATKGKSQA